MAHGWYPPASPGLKTSRSPPPTPGLECPYSGVLLRSRGVVDEQVLEARMAPPPLTLQPGEDVLVDMIPSAFWTFPKYVYTLGLWAIRRSRHRFTVTNRRAAVTAGILSYRERELPLAKVQDVTLHRSINSGGHVSLSSAGGALGIEQIGPLSRAKASEFAAALTALVSPRSEGAYSPTWPPPAPTHMVSDLERLTALRERGALSDEEFNSLKRKLLSG